MSEIKEKPGRRNVRKAQDLDQQEWAGMIPLLRTEKLNTLTLTRSVTTFQHMGFLRSTHERTVGMRRPGCANSHVALVRVDPVEQSLRSHPFHGQTTLQQQNRTDQWKSSERKTQHRLF